jgi:hypothetical protein
VRRISGSAPVQSGTHAEGEARTAKYYAEVHAANTQKPQGLADRGNQIKGGE